MDIFAVINFWALFIFVNAKKDIDYDYLGLAIAGEGKEPQKTSIKKPVIEPMTIDGSDIILLRLKNPETVKKYIQNLGGGALDKDVAKLRHDLRCGCSSSGGTDVEPPKTRFVNTRDPPNGLPALPRWEYNKMLRSSAPGCAGKVAGLLCSLRCGTASGYCSDGGICYCNQNEADDRLDVNADDGDDNDLLKSNNDQIENQEFNPALRHHIAHFCPNVEEARLCIRTCMEQGKPAFCGKDHVCYCGHRYNEHDKEPEGQEIDNYREFKDLYNKYFQVKRHNKHHQ